MNSRASFCRKKMCICEERFYFFVSVYFLALRSNFTS